MSAAGYTNRIRTKAEARVVKVQYPLHIGVNYNPLYASIACSSIYKILKYRLKPQNCTGTTDVPCIPPGPTIYYGGGAFDLYPDDLYGNGALNPPTLILNGGNSEE
jgi:hypothetical protein